MQRRQPGLLVGPHVARKKQISPCGSSVVVQAVQVIGQVFAVAGSHQLASPIVGPQRVGAGPVRTIDLGGVDERCQIVYLLPWIVRARAGASVELRPRKCKSGGAEDRISGRNRNGEAFRSSPDGSVADVVVQELPPLPEYAAGLGRVGNGTALVHGFVADESRTGQPVRQGRGPVCIRHRGPS